MENNFKILFELTDELTVSEFEKRMEIRLPDAYRKFLLQYNVAMPSAQKFITEQKNTESVEVFFGLTDKKLLDLSHNRVKGVVNDIPREYLPIGEDGGGNKICIKISDYENGSVWFFDHEEPAGHNISRVSNSFSEFINMLF